MIEYFIYLYRIYRFILILVISLFISSCNNTGLNKTDIIEQSSILYQNNLTIKVNDEEIQGFGIVKRASAYKIEIPGEYKKLLISDCAGEREFNNVKDLMFYHTPSYFMTTNYSCIMEVHAYTKEMKKYSSMFDFTADEDLKPYDIYCNWNNTDTKQNMTLNGASFCENRVNKPIMIWFYNNIKRVVTECNEPRTDTGKRFEITVQPGFCLFLFEEEKPNGKSSVHRLVTYGFNSKRLEEN